MSAYLQVTDTDYVAPNVTLTNALIVQASAIVNGHCKRAIDVQEYTERVYVIEDTQRGHLTYAPIVAITLLKGRPKYGVILNNFFGPPAFEELDLQQIDYDSRLGNFILSYSAYFIPYVEAEITYTSGWAAIPDEVKVATGLVINQLARNPNPNVQNKKDSDFSISYFGNNLITPDIAALLEPYVLMAFR
jgi:hypothetical protein